MYRFRFALLLICSIILTCQALVSIPLTKLEPVQRSLKHHIRGRFGHPNIEPLDYSNTFCFGYITIGDQFQPFKVGIDTDLLSTWIPSTKCQSDACVYHNQYDSSASNTFKSNGTKALIHYNVGDITGILSTDTVSIAGLEIKDQTFIETTSEPNFFFDQPYDGMLGLGYQEQSIVHNMIQQGLIDKPVFSFYLASEGSEVVFGSSSRTHYKGEFTYVPISKQGNWQIKIDKVIVNSTQCTDSFDAILRPTSSVMTFGPKEACNSINAAIHAWEYFDEGVYIVDCDSMNQLPSIDLIIAGKTFSLQPKDYIIIFKGQYGTYCLSMFVPKGSNHPWIFGGKFFEKYYTEFDMGNNRVGLAEAVHSNW